MSELGLGRVKTPACNLRVEIPSRFRQLENQKYCDHYHEKTIEKAILRILGSCTFSRSQGQQRRFDPQPLTSGLPPDWLSRSTDAKGGPDRDRLPAAAAPVSRRTIDLKNRIFGRRPHCADFVAEVG
jgi:hypothetical protein